MPTENHMNKTKPNTQRTRDTVAMGYFDFFLLLWIEDKYRTERLMSGDCGPDVLPLGEQGHAPVLRSLQDFHIRIKVQIGFQLAARGQSLEDFGGLPHWLLYRHAFPRLVSCCPLPCA